MKRFIVFMIIVLMYTMTIASKSNNSAYNFEKDVKKILKKVSPSIVKVVAVNNRKYVATGIVVSKSKILSNIVITKYHYNKIYVETVNKTRIPVKLIGKDKRTGLILLETKTRKLTPLKKGKYAETGDWVVLVGAFYNKIPAIYQGIVSSTSKEELILNAPLPPGGIGSAVLNRNGNLIGVVRGKLKFSSSPSYNFNNESGNITIAGKRSRRNDLCYAVPIQRMDRIISQFKKYGKAKWGWLGVNIDLYKTKKGVVITSVLKDSPASRSKLKKGDVIVNINKRDIDTVTDLQRSIRRIMPGTKVNFIIIRNGKKTNQSVKIGEQKPYVLKKSYEFEVPEAFKNIKMYDEISRFPKIDIEKFKINIAGTPKLGVYTKQLNKRDAAKFKSKKDYGLLVTALTSNGAAKKYGIKKWDILLGAKGKKFKKKNDLLYILRKSKPKSKIPFTICRNGKIINVSVVPKHKYAFNKELLRESLKDISVLVSEEFDIHNKIEIDELNKKMIVLQEKEKHMNHSDKKKLQKEIYLIKRKIKKNYELEYKKMKIEQIKILKKLKALEKKLNK